MRLLFFEILLALIAGQTLVANGHVCPHHAVHRPVQSQNSAAVEKECDCDIGSITQRTTELTTQKPAADSDCDCKNERTTEITTKMTTQPPAADDDEKCDCESETTSEITTEKTTQPQAADKQCDCESETTSEISTEMPTQPPAADVDEKCDCESETTSEISTEKTSPSTVPVKKCSNKHTTKYPTTQLSSHPPDINEDDIDANNTHESSHPPDINEDDIDANNTHESNYPCFGKEDGGIYNFSGNDCNDNYQCENNRPYKWPCPGAPSFKNDDLCEWGYDVKC